MARTWFVRSCVVYAVAVCILSAAIALQTVPNAHPDELIHGDAFCYYQNQLWPPAPNRDDLYYGPDGMSRVYNGEIVYWLWGRVGAAAAPLFGRIVEEASLIVQHVQPPASRPFFIFLPFVAARPICLYDLRLYRLLNTLLLAATLSVLIYCGRRHWWPLSVAAVVFCAPQVIYVYSYANSDAWGLSMSLFLFTFAVTTRRPFAAPQSALLLGLLTALVILSKQPYWVTLPFSYLWIVAHSDWLGYREWPAAVRRSTARHLALWAATILIVVAPLKVVYPLSIANYQQQVEQMREDRALAGFKPSALTNPGFRLAARGIPFDAVWRNPLWYQSSAASLYGNFGYMNVPLSPLHYQAAAGLLLLFAALTGWFGWARRRLLANDVKLALWASPLFVGLNVLASLYNSWTYDNQPQGRYLFPALIPLALLLTVTVPDEPRWSRALRVSGWLIAAVLCLVTLHHYVLANTALTR